jgi:hypothetical protein
VTADDFTEGIDAAKDVPALRRALQAALSRAFRLYRRDGGDAERAKDPAGIRRASRTWEDRRRRAQAAFARRHEELTGRNPDGRAV